MGGTKKLLEKGREHRAKGREQDERCKVQIGGRRGFSGKEKCIGDSD